MKDSPEKVQARVVDSLRNLANQQFTFSQLRALSKVDARGDYTDTVWNLWRSLQEARVVEEEKPRRKRNKIYKVVDVKKLEAFRPITEPMPAKPTLERRLEALERKVDEFEPLAQMLSKLMQLNETAVK